jgi:hypothetical protein
MNQRLADIPVQKLDRCRPFTNVQVDLAGDIKVKAMNNARSTLKTYPLIFACMNTGAIALQLMHAYDTCTQTQEARSRGPPSTWLTPPTTLS